VELKVLFNAHHLGHVVFGICPNSDLAGAAYGTPPPLDCSKITDPVQKEACDANYLSPVDVHKPAKDLMDCFLGEGEWAGGKDGAGKLERSEEHEHLDPAPIDENHKDRWYIPPREWVLEDGTEGDAWPITETTPLTHTMYFKVPQNLKCKNGRCLLHFFYWTANSCTTSGYNEYFSENIQGRMTPRTRCTGGKCPTGHVDVRPLSRGTYGWAMGGTWWHPQQNGQSSSYPQGTCDARVNDHPLNTWARNSPERFWNCANVFGPGGGSGTPPGPVDPCAGVVCAPEQCKTSACDAASGGTCQSANKANGVSCSANCNSECRSALCQDGVCECVAKTNGLLCMGGKCNAGVCEQAAPAPAPVPVPVPGPGPTPPAGPAVDCVATIACSYSACSAECGGGRWTKTCTREVTVPASGGGKSCDEVASIPAEEEEDCNTEECPKDPGSCIGPALAEGGVCTPEPLGCQGTPRCCGEGLVCCGNQWWASCKATCGASEVSFAAGKEDGGASNSKLMTLIAGILGGGICGGFVVFAALRARGGAGAGGRAMASREQGDV